MVVFWVDMFELVGGTIVLENTLPPSSDHKLEVVVSMLKVLLKAV